MSFFSRSDTAARIAALNVAPDNTQAAEKFPRRPSVNILRAERHPLF
jgi:hypothetical protein